MQQEFLWGAGFVPEWCSCLCPKLPGLSFLEVFAGLDMFDGRQGLVVLELWALSAFIQSTTQFATGHSLLKDKTSTTNRYSIVSPKSKKG